ncbi:MAG: hypothetical protein IV088_15260 [Hydrogenophaga sp.]|uniref:hypothetical protein n=1 Tax=Hydrogenophaga sp. TaxID=1904254 RepID=UPI0025BE8B62|nr:hypothetical protein [Hydrogenophaga sp.]MBT9552206.1 hypothetical protein [Hydrogenophaga sp.]
MGRLICASISPVDGPVLDEMRRIRDHALVHNAEHGLRVVLMHTCGWFTPERCFATEARGLPWQEARTGDGAPQHAQLWGSLKTVLDGLG